MTTPTRLAVPAVLLAIALALTGCASKGVGSAAAPTPSASATSSPVPLIPPKEAGPGGVLAHLTVRTGDVAPTGGPRWTVATTSADDRSVTVTWADSLSTSCGAVDAAVVHETTSSVEITLVRHQREPRRMCALVLGLRHAVIPLSAPLAQRTLLEPESVAVLPIPSPVGSCPPRPVAHTSADIRGATPAQACPLFRPAS